MKPTRSAGIAPARLSFDAQGTPRASTYDDVYHSADGALGQAAHVFLHGNGLPERWRGRRSFTILETGFGLGLNFLATWDALQADAAAPSRLNYVAVEKHPLASDDLETVHARWPGLADHAQALRDAWPPATRGFHRLDFDRGRVSLTLLFGDAAELLAELDARVDAIYLDGFAPDRNPQMWSDALFREIRRVSIGGTTVATWTVAAVVRQRLAHAGFEVQRRLGYARKREMLVATCSGVQARRSDPVQQRHAVIVGAGLAGVWCAHALAARSWQVTLIERHVRPAQEASGNAVGAVRPALNLADNENARLARAAFLYSARRLAGDPALAQASARTGVLHLATSTAQAERMALILDRHSFPATYVQWLEATDAAHRAGCPVAGPGWWLPLGGWCRPIALCDALLARAGNRIVRRFGCSVTRIVPSAQGWRVEAAGGASIAVAPVVILASAYGCVHLIGPQALPLMHVRGQVSHLPAARERRLEIVVCGDGYVAPLAGGGHCVGATFQPEETSLDIRTDDHAANLDRLQRMLPGFGAGLAPSALSGRVALRTATADRLPACGPIAHPSAAAEHNGLYALTGLGARGLIWAPLCAEVLASQLEGEPNPVERELLAAMRPGRLTGRAA